MKIRRCVSKTLFISMALVAGTLGGVGMLNLDVDAAQGIQKIEIVIQDGETRLVRGAMLNGIPVEINIRNEDSVTHGFNSSIFAKAGKVEMSGGTLAVGKGANVYRVEPGRTMVLKLTMPDDSGGESRTYAFWCDMHHTVKGEMLLVEQSGEIGGG